MHIITSKNFDKAVATLPKKIKLTLKERLLIFTVNRHDKILHNHQLRGSLRHYRSINITGDYRLIYEQYDIDIIRLIDVGTHNQIYKK